MNEEYEWYDMESLWADSEMSMEEFEKLKKEVRDEFPNDQMMFELHLMRALNALGRKNMSDEEMLASIEEGARKVRQELEELKKKK